MPYAVREFQATPNPNAIKCVLDRPVAPSDAPDEHPDRASRSYFSRERAAADPVAAAIFAIEGVTNVLIVKDWVSVSKAPEKDWGKLKPKIKAALASVPGGAEGGAPGAAGGAEPPARGGAKA